MAKKLETPKVEKKTQAEVDEIIKSIRNASLSESTKSFVESCIRLACWFPIMLQNKNISMSRLRTMIFGKKKKKKNNGGGSDDSNGTDDIGGSSSSDTSSGDDHHASDAAPTDKNETAEMDEGNNTVPTAELENQSNNGDTDDSKGSKQNGRNGRNAHSVYENADVEWHTLENVKPGSPCPLDLCTGKLYTQPAGIIVCVDGQPMAKVTKHYIDKYRCNLCGYIVKADVPPELSGKQKVYTPEFKAHLAMHKFYLAVPYYRMESYQSIVHCPLPDSTQWDLIESLAGYCYPVFNVFKDIAANGKLIHNDDTVVRILDVIAQNNKNEHGSCYTRTGMYTTCVMAEDDEGHKIALYLNGTQHSGENVEDILENRDKEKSPIIQMSDALAMNTPATIATIACYCLSHGFRKFEEIQDYFPIQCISIMKKLGQVFDIDAKTKDLTDNKRLEYHQKHSRPIMFALYAEMTGLLEGNRLEPNGELVKALLYFKNHWVELTRFLCVPGAPIENNIVERALKLAIRVRKNSLFFKSTYSAALSGMLTSLIYTCTYADVNPVEYLTALQVHHKAVLKKPEDWLPWNYQEQMNQHQEEITHEPPAHAKAQATLPPRVNPVAAQSAADSMIN